MISLAQVKKSFEERTVLDIETLKLSVGDRVALIGGNGAGKTTMIRCILGHYLQSGDISVFGKNPRKKRMEVLKNVGFVPQFPPPLTMNVKELVEFAAHLYKDVGATPDRIYEVAHDLQLDLGLEEKKAFSKLSGGMKQKLLISLALAKDTELLIMDEPAANLDPQGRKALFERLLKTPEETIMLLSSHRVDDVEGHVNRVMEMDCGKTIKDERFESSKDFSSFFKYSRSEMTVSLQE